MTQQSHKNIYVSDDIYYELAGHKHPGQSFNGLLRELIDKASSKRSDARFKKKTKPKKTKAGLGTFEV